MQFRAASHARSEADAHPTGSVGVTVVDRYLPLVTAAYGTRVARPARTTTLARGGGGSQLNRRVRLTLGNPLLRCQEPEGRAAARAIHSLRWLRV